MTSAYWDEQQAARYRAFQYDFPEKTLAAKTVIVAGGTGGLGAALVALLAREGARLIVGYRSNHQRAEALARAIERQTGQPLTLVAGELSAPETRRAYLERVRALPGGFSALAGAAIFSGEPARTPLSELDCETMEASLRANYIGPLLLARDLGASLAATGKDAGIVLIATMQALAVFPGSVNYAGAKAALVHAARILATEWPRVRVNVVAPGATVVGMAEASVRSGKYDFALERGAIARFGRPEDVARAVRFFLEPDNYLTGQVLLVDGGLTLRR
ncbi:MAG: SDR family oxidoreductase [Acidobacteriia bacterium]|jgi:3-oxoacyl-[acyl-carrier protein] reductase|nr:SDR family oxidoreductase [Terriglobia bacterium]